MAKAGILDCSRNREEQSKRRRSRKTIRWSQLLRSGDLLHDLSPRKPVLQRRSRGRGFQVQPGEKRAISDLRDIALPGDPGGRRYYSSISPSRCDCSLQADPRAQARERNYAQG